MTGAAARRWGPIGVATFVACVWLNQGVGHDDWVPYQERVTTAPAEHLLDTARYPFAFIYRRAPDVQLYYELANSMLGYPADTAFVAHARGSVPARFSLPSPPADGKWHSPYAEVMLEYPAVALPFIVGPRLVVSNGRDYGFVFGAMMGLCLIAAIVVALDAARAAGAEGLRARGWLASGLLLAQGAMAVQRLDAATALFFALAVRAAVRREPLALGVWAGLASAAKIVPLFTLPALLAADAHYRRDRRALARFVVAFGVTLAFGLGSMFLFSNHALTDVIAYHAARGLECESTLGFLLAVWRLLSHTWMPSTFSFGSWNLCGPGADALAAACGPLSVAATMSLGWLTLRGARPERDPSERRNRVACAAFASLVALWLTAKVFSVQYMTWGIPIVLAIPGQLGVRLAWLLIAAMALTQFYICGHYELVVAGQPLGLLNLGARQALLAAAGYVAARSLAQRPPALQGGYGPIVFDP